VGGLLGGALKGAVLGMLFGGPRGAIIGAGAGAGAGTAGNIIKGKANVSFDRGARLLFELQAPVTVPAYAAPAAAPRTGSKPAS
ncbi:MAG: hypothetical protein KGL53_03610, partial [Elusimicrobia bacterium]|nr:hypothetical protein [Elusimicrobiota bacterium]